MKDRKYELNRFSIYDSTAVQRHLEEIAGRNAIANSAQLPMDPNLAAACDAGQIEMFDGSWLEPIADAIEKL